MLIRSCLVFLVLLFSSQTQTHAQTALDRSYIKPSSEISWGGILDSFFGNDRFGKSYALVIGVSEFSHFRDLPTAEDPIRVKDFLFNKAGFDQVHVLTESAVTRERVRELIERDFRGLIGPNDRFLLYWSGHGLTERNAIGENVGLFPTSASSQADIFSMVRMSDISSWTTWLMAEQTLFIFDACFSGHGGVASQSSTNLTLRDMSRPSRHVFTAGTANQETFASDRLRGGVFTRAVLDGLGGLADTSQGGDAPDGIISINELEIYVKKRVRDERVLHKWRKPLSPQLYGFGSNEGEFFFLSPQGKAARVSNATTRATGEYVYGIPMKAAAPYQSINEAKALSEQPAREQEFVSLNAAGWKEVQRRLQLFGLDPGAVDGVPGPNTRSALNAWQVQRGFSQSATMTTEQMELLRRETQDAYLDWLTTPKETEPVRPTQAAPTTRSNRWMDPNGCLREADGSYVKDFLERCS